MEESREWREKGEEYKRVEGRREGSGGIRLTVKCVSGVMRERFV